MTTRRQSIATPYQESDADESKTKNNLGEEKTVGTIELEAWPSTQYTSLGNHIGSMQSLVRESNSSLDRPLSNLYVAPENTTIAARHPKLTVRIELTRSVVHALDVFLLVIAVLVDAAEKGAAKVLRDYESPMNAGSLWINFEEPVPVRTSPPFFTAKWLMRAMAIIPEHMIRKGVFQEALVMVEVDDVSVADGFLMVKQAGVGFKDVKSNISVS